MRGLSTILTAFLLLLAYAAPAKDSWRHKTENPDFIHRAVKQVTDVMVHDIYSPPVASRIYAYTTIAGYEAAIMGNQQYRTLAGQLHGLTPMPELANGKTFSNVLASVHAILTVGKALVISENKIEAFHKNILATFKGLGMPEAAFKHSLKVGEATAAHILTWSAGDNYKQTRSYPKFSIDDEAGTWKPTPPSYMRAVEPNWSKIRTFIIDSAQQFKPLPPTPFSTDSTSQFYREAVAVRDAGASLTPAQQDVANFWDCNPFKMNIRGHVMFATKKISPGGHWINITRLACQKAKANFVQTAEAYACVSVTLADGFISCWDEKYRSNVIRPETYINQYVDAAWMPLLQTPPFPEYTSGHSVISTASALMLTHLFGYQFSFADSTEIEFGLPVRHFSSFKQAAEEAAISRFYGGIHYMPSIINGVKEGTEIGHFIIRTLKTQH